MAQFRQNHTRQSKGLQTTFRLVIFLIIAVAALAGGYYYFKIYIHSYADRPVIEEADRSLRTFLPTSSGEIIHHTY